MNYSETYFKLDSEEATHCDHCHLIYIKGHVKTVDAKDQSNAIVYFVWHPLCLLKSWIEPTSRPLSCMNSGVTKFTLAPLSIKQVVSTPSKMAVPRLALLSHRFLGSSFQNAEGVNCGPASFRPWPYLCGGAGLPWS